MMSTSDILFTTIHVITDWSISADIVQAMIRDCGHSTGDDRRLRT
ncbi:unnamed protein product [Staurois parvus]|uniref:Uncharacterized protein n=1 Tax=Staurois parvus TaxID=386267 RepID=A0ABN9CXE9_9NEOB|nr:unnamed protein product [Staurois parvus]